MSQRTIILAMVSALLLVSQTSSAQRFLEQLEGVLDAEAKPAPRPAEAIRSPGYLGFIAIEDSGRVEIELIRAGSAAERAGLRAGDIITHVDGRAIKSLDHIGAALAGRFAGDRVAISIARDGRAMLVPATLSKRPVAAAEVDEVPPEPDPFAPELPREVAKPKPEPKAEVPIDALDALRVLEDVLDAETAEEAAAEEAVAEPRPKIDAEREKRIAVFESELEAIKRRIRQLEREVGELADP